METIEHVTKTFKDVHEDIALEAKFLEKRHDIKDFSEKADFLIASGFSNSIATKMYRAIAESADVIKEYQMKYHGLYKFILAPQLERLCEKYNLFVRKPEFFMGDIPEPNLKDMMNFKIFADDLPFDLKDTLRIIKENQNEKGFGSGDLLFSPMNFVRRNAFNRVDLNSMGFNEEDLSKPFFKPQLNLSQLNMFDRIVRGSLIEIAAIKSLFAPTAFVDNDSRMLNNHHQGEARFQVDLDPIVLCRTKHGYLVVTAWGDEANDELIVNEKKN